MVSSVIATFYSPNSLIPPNTLTATVLIPSSASDKRLLYHRPNTFFSNRHGHRPVEIHGLDYLSSANVLKL